MSVTLTDIQKVALTATVLDAKGNPTTAPGVPTWSVSDTSLLSLTVAADGMSAEALALGPLGTAAVTVSVDVPNSTPITGTIDVIVIGSAPASVSIAAGTPEAQ